MAKKSEAIPFVTPWMTARFPKISKPDTQGKFADGKFKTDGIVDEDDLPGVEKALNAAAKSFWPDADDVSMPLKDFFKDKEKKELAGRGLTLKSQYKPACFDTKKKKLPDGVQIGGGSEIRVASAIFPWSKTTKMKTKDAKGKVTTEDVTEFGIGLRLGDIQLRKLVVFAGAGDGAAFDEVEEGGFEYDGEGDTATKSFDDASDL
jgi:hypothetical protein